MAYINNRRLPVGIQSFKKIREDKYLYIDKSDIIWQLANNGTQYNYLSRPRRFGKSVLVDTLKAYFEGRRDLFEGLKIMDLETDWKQYPVIRLDMSRGGASADSVRSYFNTAFKGYEEEYGIVAGEDDSLSVRFNSIIMAAYRKTGMQVAILIDEYDAPLQHSWQTPEHDACTAIYREVFAILKADDEFERFVFITGITKFTQISLFSVLNNLFNISFEPQFAAICGITEKEISDNFKPELEEMSKVNGWTIDETHRKLKEYYDGYHFSRRNMTDIYNPFSLVTALNALELRNFWAQSGATSMLPKFVDNMELRLEQLDNCFIDRDTLETSDVTGGGAELFLYQTGYLTIKDFDDDVYTLGFPNEEVKRALYRVVVPALTMRTNSDVVSTQSLLLKMMADGKVSEAMKALKAIIADVPYSNKKLASMDMEERYRLIISTVFNAIGFKVEVEHMLATGRIDIIAKTARYIYVLELKLSNNGGKEAAAKQIADRNYTEPFKADKRKVIALAVELDSEGKGLTDWQVVE